MYVSPLREPLIQGDKDYKTITADITAPVSHKPTIYWFIGFTIASTAATIGLLAMVMTVWKGIGLWGVNRTIGWGWSITNLVWWIGIGHAGTFISAILLLFRQKWRTSINRSAVCRSDILSFPTRIPAEFGLTLIRRFCGTYLPLQPIFWFLCYSGIWDSCPISLRFAIR
jgi:hypothetical protein